MLSVPSHPAAVTWKWMIKDAEFEGDHQVTMPGTTLNQMTLSPLQFRVVEAAGTSLIHYTMTRHNQNKADQRATEFNETLEHLGETIVVLREGTTEETTDDETMDVLFATIERRMRRKST
jgi:hypothetical protein